MNWKCLMMVCGLPFAAIAAEQQPAAAADAPVGVYQLTDMQGKLSYQIMTKSEFKGVETLLKEEGQVFNAALTDAKKDWMANKDNPQFYGWNKIKARTIKMQGIEFKKRDLADKKLAQFEDRIAKKIEQEEKMNKGKSERDTAKEEKKAEIFQNVAKLVSSKLSEKLHRRVPDTGFSTQDLAGEKEPLAADAAKDGAKKEAEKK